MSYLELSKISKYFNNPEGEGEPLCVFKDVDLKINESEFITVVGHSGCGKSTMLNIIAGLDEASEGGVILEGREVNSPGLDRSVVFQNFALIPWMTVYQNIRLAVKAANPDWNKDKIREYSYKYIDLVNLRQAANKRPSALSGGMKQRVGLARAFCINPKVLLLDEPFAQIDALTRGVIQDELVEMWNASKNTVFMVTHDVDEAILLSDRVVLMTNGPNARIGEIIEIDIPRPRERTTIIDHPHYYKIRNHIIHFLIERSQKMSGAAKSDADAEQAPPPSEGSRVVHFRDEASESEPHLRAIQ
ncbi:MAG: nitrate ABC transporter ATP-binding protein [Nitrospinae bacterium]|jgi:nitrate/nitrite transport system ATP-binding protein|nr:nitrate ABC transporter ATP-binding protein [Nitrospinota bacterium]MDA1108250.1 nitrate ABC transporter ATP-binding protein [Nitrospinota bacterium]